MQQPCSDYRETCSSVVYQAVDISLPISLMPSVDLGGIKIMCCDEPRVECCEAVGGRGGIDLKITQTLTYKIHVDYRVESSAGDATSVCKRSHQNAICTQCHCQPK